MVVELELVIEWILCKLPRILLGPKDSRLGKGLSSKPFTYAYLWIPRVQLPRLTVGLERWRDFGCHLALDSLTVVVLLAWRYLSS